MWRGRNWPWHVRSWTARPSRQREDVSDRTGRVCLCQPRVIRITVSANLRTWPPSLFLPRDSPLSHVNNTIRACKPSPPGINKQRIDRGITRPRIEDISNHHEPSTLQYQALFCLLIPKDYSKFFGISCASRIFLSA